MTPSHHSHPTFKATVLGELTMCNTFYPSIRHGAPYRALRHITTNSCTLCKGPTTSISRNAMRVAALSLVAGVMIVFQPQSAQADLVHNQTTYEDDLFVKYTATQLQGQSSTTAAFNGSTEIIPSQAQTLNLTKKPDAFAFQVAQVTGFGTTDDGDPLLFVDQWEPTFGLQSTSVTNRLIIVLTP